MSEPLRLKILYARLSASEVLALQPTTVPDVTERSSHDLKDLGKRPSVVADQCIYCGSVETLSDEHIIPRAWGGVQQVKRGSCEACRVITSEFETQVLRQGTMTLVRRHLAIRSRSKHSRAPTVVDVEVVRDGATVVLQLPWKEAPVILGLPWFGLPGHLENAQRRGIGLEGWFAMPVGPNPDQLARDLGASDVHFEEQKVLPLAMARAFAKIAYAHAWQDGVIDILGGAPDLVNAFMRDPEGLGSFVGMKPPPLERYEQSLFRLSYEFLIHSRSVVVEVQPFANIPAPTYWVVLTSGCLLREWRRVQQRLRERYGETS